MNWRSKSDNNRRITLNLDLIQTYVGRYKPGTWFDIEVTRKQKTVSSPMRRYFYGVVLPKFLEAYYYDPEDGKTVHKHLKCLFFNVQPDEHGVYRDSDVPAVFADDSIIPIDKKQAYIEYVKRKAAQSIENPVYIPDPGEA